MKISISTSSKITILVYMAIMAGMAFYGAQATSEYDSEKVVILNALGLFVLVLIDHILIMLPGLMVITFYLIFKGGIPDDIEDWKLRLTGALGLCLGLYCALSSFGDIYDVYKQWVVAFAFKH